MPSIKDLRIDISGFSLMEEKSEVLKLVAENGLDYLSVWFFDQAPDLPADYQKLKKLHSYYRNQLKGDEAGLVELRSNLTLGNFPAVEVILKFRGELKKGPVYLGSLIIPFEKFSFVIKVQSYSGQSWKMREQFIRGKLIAENPDSEEDIRVDWNKDPYFPDRKWNFPYNHGEGAEFDEYFPDHALSRNRSVLEELKEKIVLSNDLVKHPVLKSQKGNWWQFW